MLEILIIIILAVALDRFARDRLRVDPFDWFRDWAGIVEKRLNGGSRAQGIAALIVAIIPVVFVVLVLRYVLAELAWLLRFVFDIVVLAACIDLNRVGDRAGEVSEALLLEDMPVANENLRLLSGESADELTEASISRSAVEAVLTQGNTVVIAPLFWFIVLGPFGAVLQRLTGALDRSWGSGSERFVEFGWAAARSNDLLAWIPVRISALSYALMGNFDDAMRCWQYQVGIWSAHDSGALLAAGLGALQMQNCDAATEDEAGKERVAVTTVVPGVRHVKRALTLLQRVLLLWLGVAVLLLILNLLRA